MVVAKEEGCNSARVVELVKSFVRGAEELTDVGAELSLILPSAATFTFPALFDALEGIYHSTCTIISTDLIGCSILISLKSYRRPTYKCEDAINANANYFPDSQLLRTWDESRRAQNAIISLKMRKRNHFTTHLNVGLRYSLQTTLRLGNVPL